jgi:signal transduction histidine kinase
MRSLQQPGSRSRTPASTLSCAPAWRSSRALAPGSSRQRRRNGNGWSATCTTGHNSGWSHFRSSSGELRELASGIHPAIVTGHGLAVALKTLAARAQVPVRLTLDLDGRLPERQEVAAYYVVSESLTNVAKYARASSAAVEVRHVNGQLLVEIVDDGIGGADTRSGSGLRGLADRVEALGGRLRIWSPDGGGTRVEAVIPCA